MPTLPKWPDLTPTDDEVKAAAANIRGRTTADVIHAAAQGFAETNPRSLSALIVALDRRNAAKAARREAKVNAA